MIGNFERMNAEPENSRLYGAIIGDIVGSKFEFCNIKSKDFDLFSEGCSYTDDTIMTVAVANALLKTYHIKDKFAAVLIEEMQRLGRKYPFPQGGYGSRFAEWLENDSPKPYNSFGNGSAMRVSPCAIYAFTLEDAVEFAEISASVTHNHPEGIKGAKAVSAAIFMARKRFTKAEIKAYIEENYYPLNESIDEIRKYYSFDETCQGTVPQAIIAFLDSVSFEDAIRNAVSIGGDSDTVAAITGSIAWVYYDCEEEKNRLISKANSFLPEEFIDSIVFFDKKSYGAEQSYLRITDSFFMKPVRTE